MSISALSAGLSGLQANQRALDVAGHNIANADTAPFQASRASFEESAPAGSGVSLSVQGRSLAAAGDGGVDLAAQLSDALVYQASYALSAQVVKSADQRLGSLIDIHA